MLAVNRPWQLWRRRVLPRCMRRGLGGSLPSRRPGRWLPRTRSVSGAGAAADVPDPPRGQPELQHCKPAERRSAGAAGPSKRRAAGVHGRPPQSSPGCRLLPKACHTETQ
ncbi:hypothetical protein F751_5883 [Auxenochlorella protothecoides]|uniref:Uncharacterized protein n=1 Tax=Auxenochlorella protothecoides TaxID=3075 RepID=A0A087SMU7_AUXPR|nr:hypothetical protein F751_5883 [Auxenochlorella protothecoides]KFM27051.1 hypothetical protein F751_5883 [Auxenochlorella protothecoides]